MDLQKLFETQDALDERIVKEKGLEGQDLLPMKILALQVELGELANEWRGFKFWSEDRETNTKRYRWKNSFGETFNDKHDPRMMVENFTLHVVEVNPLLEEYVDCLHFILSIGVELGFENHPMVRVAPKTKTVTDMFLITFETINNFYRTWFLGNPEMIVTKYKVLIDVFVSLGEMLGFTWEQVEDAYYAKNQINHERQATGY